MEIAMISIPKMQGRFLDRKIHRRCAKCAKLLAIAVAPLLIGGCGWNDTWILGDWVQSYSNAPYTDVLHFEADGKRYLYEDYDSTVFSSTKTWSLNGEVLTIDSDVYIITRMSNDRYMQEEYMYYRKGTEPGGNIFGHTAMALSVNFWLEDTIPFQTLKLFSFTASGAGEYEVHWDDDFKGSAATSDIIVSAYRADKRTECFSERDSGYFTPTSVMLSSGETIFLIVDAYWRAGTFRIEVE